MKIINRKYYISNKLNKKIVLISDIHYYSKKDIKQLNKVLDNIKQINPDYICIAGDTTDNSNVSNINLFIEWLTKLSTISKVIMVLGNHEYFVDKKNSIYKLNDKYIKEINRIDNLYFLDNNNKVLDNINFIGLTLPIDHYMINGEYIGDFKKYIKNIKTNEKYYNVLLCHSPINISKEKIINKINIDLVLCGHMHGGLIPNVLKPIFKNTGLIDPMMKLFPKNAYGHIKVGNKNVIISSGIKVISESHFILLKNLFASEVVEINL